MTIKPHELGAVKYLLQYLQGWADDIDPEYLLSKRVVSKKEARKHHRQILQVLRHTDIDHLLSKVVDAINRLEDPERERIAASSREAALQAQIAILRSKLEHATVVEDTVAETEEPAVPSNYRLPDCEVGTDGICRQHCTEVYSGDSLYILHRAGCAGTDTDYGRVCGNTYAPIDKPATSANTVVIDTPQDACSASDTTPLYFRYKPSGSIDVSITPCAGKGFPLYSVLPASLLDNQPPTTS